MVVTPVSKTKKAYYINKMSDKYLYVAFAMRGNNLEKFSENYMNSFGTQILRMHTDWFGNEVRTFRNRIQIQSDV